MWTVAKKGNIAADKLASKLHKIKGDKRKPDPITSPKIDKVSVFDNNNCLIERNPSTNLKIARKALRDLKLKEYPAAGEILRDPHTHYPSSNNYLNTKSGKRERNRRIAFKGRYRRLPTRDQGLRRNYTFNKDSMMKKKITFKSAQQYIKKKVERKIFQDQACVECPTYQKENTTHIFSGECEARHATQARVAEDIRALLVEENIINERVINYFPLWVADPYQPMPEEPTLNEDWIQLRDFPKHAGALGMIPTALVKTIKSSPCTTPYKTIIIKLQDIILAGAADMWADRQRGHAETLQIAGLVKAARARYKEKMGEN